MPADEDLISVDQAALEFGRSRRKLFQWLAEGRLQRYRSEGDPRTFVSRSEIAELVKHRPARS